MAERTFNSTLENELSAANAAISFAVYLNLVGGAVRAWSGEGSLTWSSNTWYGLGKWGSMDKIVDSADAGTDIGIELILNYLDDDIRNEFNVNDSRGRDASIFMWKMQISPLVIVDSKEIFTGFVDSATLSDSAENGQLRIRLASEQARLQRPRFYRLSSADQQVLFAGDLGMQYSSEVTGSIMWGRKPTTPASPVAVPPRYPPPVIPIS